MNRTDRLYALVEELRLADAKGRTCSFLADRFEVTARTIKRDISALQQAGLPVVGQPGPIGGYRLLASSSTLPPVSFTPGEAAAIAVALNTQANLPYATEGAAALTKILGAMSAESRQLAHQLMQRVW